MSRVIHGQNDLLTPFELMAHNIRVYGGRSTYQNSLIFSKNKIKKIEDIVNHPNYES